MTRRLDVADGYLKVVRSGGGSPVTVFAHGIGATVAETRPLGSGVLGSRVFFAFRGHDGSSPMGEGWDYGALAGDLRAVADAYGATRALGVSMGAGALTRLLAEAPDRFERVVFFLPAVLDRPRADLEPSRLAALADALETGDRPRLERLLLDEQPEGVRDLPGVGGYVRARARMLLDSGLAPALRALPARVAVEDRAALAAVRVPALVVGQQGDDVHPAAVAEELAAALPHARLHVFSQAGAMWLAPRRLREVVAGFLNEG